MQKKDGYITINDLKMYYKAYKKSFNEKKNKNMSNYKDKNITLGKVLYNWYIENRKENEMNHKILGTGFDEG